MFSLCVSWQAGRYLMALVIQRVERLLNCCRELWTCTSASWGLITHWPETYNSKPSLAPTQFKMLTFPSCIVIGSNGVDLCAFRVLNTESSRPLTTWVFSSGTLSHLSTRRLSSGTRPNTAAPLHSHLAWYRGTTHTPLDPSVNRSLSAPSNKSRNTQPELKPEPVEYQNHNNRQNRRSSSPRTWSAFQTTVFGPQSDIRNLISELKPSSASEPGFPSIDRTRVLHRAGWCHLPGRYVLEERTVTALNREIGYPLHTQRCTPLVRQTGQGQGGEQSWRDRVSYSARKQ